MYKVRRIEVNDTILRTAKIKREDFRNKLDSKLKSAGINADISVDSEDDCLFFMNEERGAFSPELVPRYIHVSEDSATDTPQNVVFGPNVTIGPNVFVGGNKVPLSTSNQIEHRIYTLIIETAKELWPREA